MQSGKGIKKKMPVLYGKRQNCCGCSACYAVCPVGAIRMQPNRAGFLYPVIDKQKCICCYQCLGVCAFQADQAKKGYPVA
ncbi:MAG: 4Fe-4S dicluster domain-containing protein [Lachnospiraceae bacterium]|nr:4Fe-4S dicluster domain-containing protein [Lachnospiraceae bacterium]